MREIWNHLLPSVPSDDRRPQLRHELLLFSEDQKSALVGQCFAWGSHLVYNSTQSNAVALRYIYWGKVLTYGSHHKSPYQLIPGLSVDPWFHVTSQNPTLPFPAPFRSPFSLRPHLRHLTKSYKNKV